MAGRTKKELEEENLELREKLEGMYDDLADFLGIDDGDEDDEEEEDDEDE